MNPKKLFESESEEEEEEGTESEHSDDDSDQPNFTHSLLFFFLITLLLGLFSSVFKLLKGLI